ncbi:MAG: hypothetical protein HRU28_10980 [Rhizobiales bacterium]|nr:hypothetical protein [Hyphomicrobiales bacterium]
MGKKTRKNIKTVFNDQSGKKFTCDGVLSVGGKSLKLNIITDAEIELVKHLARIAAEHDYKKLLNSKKVEYDSKRCTCQDSISGECKSHTHKPQPSGDS